MNRKVEYAHTPMNKCPAPGCEIFIPPARRYCTKHWRKLSWRKQRAWMRRNQGANK